MTKWKLRQSGLLLVLVAMAAAVLVACGGDSPAPAAAPSTPPRDTQIEIVGSESFVAQVEAALYLLGVHVPETLVWVEGSVETILLTPFGAYTAQDVIEGKVRVVQDQAFAPGYAASDQAIWLAGVLVFEACVNNRYRGGGDYSDTATVTCLKEQILVLKRLDRSDFFAGMVEDHLYGNYGYDLIESVPDPDYCPPTPEPLADRRAQHGRGVIRARGC
ncbi:MAG: hypothetical protein OXE43_08270 [Chloroflexi bacterium]|nr:hypothetical protein [Chloroflexota bacterium]